MRTGGDASFFVPMRVDRAAAGFLLPEMPRLSCEVLGYSDGEMGAMLAGGFQFGLDNATYYPVNTSTKCIPCPATMNRLSKNRLSK